MYRITYLPVANQDLIDTVRYISEQLQDTAAALALIDDIERMIAMLAQFPYAHPIHSLPMKLPRETRFFSVRNYLVFYVVLEPQHTVEIQRVIYNRMDRAGIGNESQS